MPGNELRSRHARGDGARRSRRVRFGQCRQWGLDANGNPLKVSSPPRAFFEITSPGTLPRAVAPPTQFIIDFSNPLDRSKLGPVDPLDPNRINPDFVQLIRSTDSGAGSSGKADGDFGFDATFQLGTPESGKFTRVANTTVRLINDGHAFALAESTLGAGRGAPNVMCIVCGTGIGGGLVLDGRLHLGPKERAGEFGHHTVIEDGPPDY